MITVFESFKLALYFEKTNLAVALNSDSIFPKLRTRKASGFQQPSPELSIGIFHVSTSENRCHHRQRQRRLLPRRCRVRALLNSIPRALPGKAKIFSLVKSVRWLNLNPREPNHSKN